MAQRDSERIHRRPQRRGAKWEELRGVMRKEITSGSWAAGSAIPGQNHLAATYGVSVNTVREAVAALVHEGLLIRKRGRKTVVSPQAGHPRLSMDVFAFLSREASGTDSRTMVEMLAGISNAVREFGLTMHLHRVVQAAGSGHAVDMETVIRASEAVLAVHRVRNVVLPICRTLDCPFVVVDGLGESGPFPQVTYDRRESARIATEYVCRLGHCRVAHLGPDSHGVTEMQRQLGFLDVIRSHGLDLPGGYLVRSNKDFAALREATRTLLHCDPRPTCVCCSTDNIASSVLTVLQEEGLSVPGDVALISFTDDPSVDEAPVPLSGVYQPFEEVGYEAVQLLRKVMAGEASPNETVRIPPRLVLRKSC